MERYNRGKKEDLKYENEHNYGINDKLVQNFEPHEVKGNWTETRAIDINLATRRTQRSKDWSIGIYKGYEGIKV